MLIKAIIILTKALDTATVYVTSSFKGKACSSVFIERKLNHPLGIHRSYLQWGNHCNRLLRIHNDVTPEEAGLQSELGQDLFALYPPALQ